MNRVVKILAIALIYCGTVFGAGFASGQEIFRFFSAYGMWGIVTAIFVGFLFSVFGWFICFRAKQFSLADGMSYFRFLFSSKIATMVSVLCSLFLAVTFCIMIAGCGTLAREHLSLRPVVGATASLALCVFIIQRKVQGLAGLNAVITPFLFLGVIAFCVLILQDAENGAVLPAWEAPGNALFSGVLYVSYNIVSVAAVLAPAAHMATTKEDAALGGLLGGILVAIPQVLMTICLALWPECQIYPLPFFTLVCSKNSVMAPLCALLLFGAMLTTAASAGVSVLAKVPKRYSHASLVSLCLLALLASFVPFDALVRVLYTAFGVCGLVVTAGIIKSIWR